jgi:hypothetical protein
VSSRKMGPIRWLETKLSLGLQEWRLPSAVQEQPLSLDADAVDFEAALLVTSNVLDGLGTLGGWGDFSARIACEPDDNSGGTHCVDLLDPAIVRNLGLPNEYHARIQQRTVAISPIPKSLPINVRAAAIRSLECLQSRTAEVRDGNRLLTMNPAMGAMESHIENMPHLQASLDVDALRDSERNGFLREATILKGVPADRAELLAVFRHVPIEMISRLRFLAETKTIVYSISGGPSRTHTRVHDLAAVRDTASRDIHLIPHRTKFRQVSLN